MNTDNLSGLATVRVDSRSTTQSTCRSRRRLGSPSRGRIVASRAGIRFFNLLNTFNPQDLQNNLASPYHGVFYRGVKRKIRAVFEIGY